MADARLPLCLTEEAGLNAGDSEDSDFLLRLEALLILRSEGRLFNTASLEGLDGMPPWPILLLPLRLEDSSCFTGDLLEVPIFFRVETEEDFAIGLMGSRTASEVLREDGSRQDTDLPNALRLDRLLLRSSFSACELMRRRMDGDSGVDWPAWAKTFKDVWLPSRRRDLIFVGVMLL